MNYELLLRFSFRFVELKISDIDNCCTTWANMGKILTSSVKNHAHLFTQQNRNIVIGINGQRCLNNHVINAILNQTVLNVKYYFSAEVRDYEPTQR